MSAPPSSIAFAIPAYNEADGIVEFLTDLDAVASGLTGSLVFVVADDCSSDDTREVLEKAAPSLGGAVVVSPGDRNRGHGPTVLRAYREALDHEPDAVFQVDGDGQFEAADVLLLLDALEQGADVVTGRRRTRVDPWFRKLLTRLLRQFLRFGFGVRRADANCPFRLYRAPVLADILAQLPPDAMVPHVMMSVIEERLPIRTVEIEVRHRVRRGEEATGTMWRSRRTLIVPWRLVTFSAAALREMWRFRSGLQPSR